VPACSVIAGLDPAAYSRHGLHDPARDWPETNCYVDLLIEVLARRGFDPRAALGFTVAQDYEGDQFTFFKYPAADLAQLYNVELLELSIFDRLEDHLREQIARDRLPIVEVDSFYLPDTKGVGYHRTHGKTTIAVNTLDPDGHELGYFHNAGYFRLGADDYDALFRAPVDNGLPLFPYVEFLKFGTGRGATDPIGIARTLLSHHLYRRPVQNPFRAWRDRLERDLDRLSTRPPEWFHAYAFNHLRQAGANFGLLGAHLAWLQEHGEPGLEKPKASAEAISNGAKIMQFQLARAVARKRFPDFAEAVDRLAADYDTTMDALAARYITSSDAAA
jgi:hypothetical protein